MDGGRGGKSRTAASNHASRPPDRGIICRGTRVNNTAARRHHPPTPSIPRQVTCNPHLLLRYSRPTYSQPYVIPRLGTSAARSLIRARSFSAVSVAITTHRDRDNARSGRCGRARAGLPRAHYAAGRGGERREGRSRALAVNAAGLSPDACNRFYVRVSPALFSPPLSLSLSSRPEGDDPASLQAIRRAQNVRTPEVSAL